MCDVQILGRTGCKGTTFADLKKALEQYRRSIARKSTSGEYGLLGDAIPEKSQLAWVGNWLISVAVWLSMGISQAGIQALHVLFTVSMRQSNAQP